MPQQVRCQRSGRVNAAAALENLHARIAIRIGLHFGGDGQRDVVEKRMKVEFLGHGDPRWRRVDRGAQRFQARRGKTAPRPTRRGVIGDRRSVCARPRRWLERDGGSRLRQWPRRGSGPAEHEAPTDRGRCFPVRRVERPARGAGRGFVLLLRPGAPRRGARTSAIAIAPVRAARRDWPVPRANGSARRA